MTIGLRLFISSAIFGVAIATAYWFSSYDYTGTVLLGLMAAALIFGAAYMIIAEREARLIGDRPNASMNDGAGEELGVFTTWTPWPLFVAFGAFLLLLGLAMSPAFGIVGGMMLFFGLYKLMRESR